MAKPSLRKLKRIIQLSGGSAKIGAALGLSRQCATMWKRGVPAEHVLTIESMSGVPRHEIRPDIYPPPTAGEA